MKVTCTGHLQQERTENDEYFKTMRTIALVNMLKNRLGFELSFTNIIKNKIQELAAVRRQHHFH